MKNYSANCKWMTFGHRQLVADGHRKWAYDIYLVASH